LQVSGKNLQAAKVAQVMLTTGNDKLNDATKQLVIIVIKQQMEKILHKLCKNETGKDNDGSDMSVPPTKKRKLH